MRSRARYAAIIVLGVTLAACGGIDLLLELSVTVDQYFSSGDFAYDVLEVAYFAGKVLGSGAG